MANLELCPLSSYDLCLAPESTDIHFVKLTDSLYKALEDYHVARHKGTLVLTTSKQNKGGSIEINTDQDRKKYKFSRISFPKNNGLDCLSQTHTSNSLTIIGTAPDKLTVHAKEDVYQNTKEKMISIEDKRQENQTQMIELNKKQRTSKAPVRRTQEEMSRSTCNRPSMNFKAAPAQESKNQRSLRERAIHVLALRPHRKPELLSKLNDGKGKSKDFVTKVLAQVSHTQNNMFHLKNFLYNEVQVDTWPDYSDSDRDNLRQQLKLLNMDGGAPDNKRVRGASSSSDSSALDEHIIEKKEIVKPPEKVTPPVLPNAEKFAPSKPPNFAMESKTFTASSSKHPFSKQPASKADHFVPAKLPTPAKQHFVPATKSTSSRTSEEAPTKPALPSAEKPAEQPSRTHNNIINHTDQSKDQSKESRKRALAEPVKSSKKLCTGVASNKTQEVVRKTESKRKICQQFKLPFAETLETSLRALHKKFTKITGPDQQQRYLEEFNREYNDYLEMKKLELQASAEFTETESLISQCTKGSPEYRRLEKKARDMFSKHKSDPKWLQNKEKVLLLEGKLGTIKLLLEEYERSKAG